MDLPHFVVFGPQTEWPSEDCLSRLRHDLLCIPELASLKEAMRSLPDLWPLLLTVAPRIEKTNLREALTKISEWLDTDALRESRGISFENALLSPLTVILHTVQYVKWISKKGMTSSGTDSLPAYGLEGMCTGLLTAISASLSRDIREIASNASVALRLAACIGAIIDLNGGYADSDEKVQAIVVQWNSELEHVAFLHTMNSHPKAYVSVIKDATSSTIVVPKSEIEIVTQKLSSYGMKLIPLTLTGRYHHSSNMTAARNLITICQSSPQLQFPSSAMLRIPLRAGDDCHVISNDGALHELAIKALLTERINWQGKITAALAQFKHSDHVNLSFMVIGLVNCVPRRIDGWQISKKLYLSEEIHQLHLCPSQAMSKTRSLTSEPSTIPRPRIENAVAVVGMACRFPGANTLDEFWDLLTEGTSMLSEVPEQRFRTDNLRRSPKGSQFLGNFLRDAEAFDRQFFKISSREATSMDPQQRLLLEVAYEAMQSAQYFDGQIQNREFGCYIGAGSVDYQDNIYSHQPTAYSAVGSLRAFLSGRVSHHFGWTGPAITYDTACSSSLVALHSACKALLAGECNGALAGGVNVITSPALYQNLGAASFLSPSGASKAFDAAADGYCRGEGCGLVVLKRLSDAIDADDHILSIIAGSAINQSDNSVSITVPHSDSQSSLYKKVLSQTGISARDVSYVEAHGTGTPVGDPIECQSIRNIFGGAHRDSTLHMGSVKGNIGHLEAASGVAALIKSILMIQKSAIPKQANFSSLNPKIPPLEPDKMAIAIETIPWQPEFRAICINNYGASGTNGALVVCEPPTVREKAVEILQTKTSSFHKHLICLSANSIKSLQAYCALLREQVFSHEAIKIADLAFNLQHQQELVQKYRVSETVESMSQLRNVLTRWESYAHQPAPEYGIGRRPMILCFGGHSSPILNVDQNTYNNISVFRYHLDNVDKTLREVTGYTILPHIFSKDPITDSVVLHCSLFALQYVSAMCWIESGAIIDTVVGHSFGQITAMCISGVLSLKDALIYVARRAAIFEKKWAAEKGEMIAVRTGVNTVLELLKQIPEQLDIACYNSPSDIVVAGSEIGIKAFEKIAVSRGFQTQILHTDRAFHSRFMDDALPELAELASTLTYETPKIRIETCTQGQSGWSHFTAERLVTHSRQAVYFNDAIQRIEQRLGPCIWLEAGSRSAVTKLTSKCIHGDENIILPVDLSLSHCEDSLIQTTTRLRDCGYPVQYWPYHRRQRHSYQHMNLPPYQFDKSPYWLEFKDFSEKNENSKRTLTTEENAEMLQFLEHRDTAEKKSAVFAVKPACGSYQAAVSGHAVMGNGLCPASLYIELAAQAACYLVQTNVDGSSTAYLPQVGDLRILSPLGLDTTLSVQLVLQRSVTANNWTFSLLSVKGDRETHHASGNINLQEIGNQHLHTKRDTLEKFVGASRGNTLLNDRLAESMQGPLVYRVFDRVVNYKSYYQGVRQVASKGSETAGVITMPENSAHILTKSVTGPLTMDNYLQVAGIHVNCLRELSPNELYICTFVKDMQMYNHIENNTGKPQSWMVYVYTKQEGEKTLESDILAFDQATGSLSMALQGVKFSRIGIKSLARSLSALNPNSAATDPKDTSISESLNLSSFKTYQSQPLTSQVASSSEPPSHLERKPETFITRVKEILSGLTDLSAESINEDETLDALGIDSLMINEMISEIRTVFNINVDQNDTGLYSTVSALSDYILSKTGSFPSQLPISKPAWTSKSTEFNTAIFLSDFVDVPIDEIRDEKLMDELGIDSLMETEVISEIRTRFGITIPATNFPQLSVADLSKLLNASERVTSSTIRALDSISSDGKAFATPVSTMSTASSPFKKLDYGNTATNNKNKTYGTSFMTSSKSVTEAADHIKSDSSYDFYEAFNTVKHKFHDYAIQTQFAGFYADVHPRQVQLVTSYILEAFDSMGCPLTSIPEGAIIPTVPHLPKHDKLVRHIYNILEIVGFITRSDNGYKRTGQSINIGQPSQDLLGNILQEFPQHQEEHRLLSITGPHLADCLRGTTDAISLIFGSKESKDLLSSVYLNAPMFATGTKMLCELISNVMQSSHKRCPSQTIRILEIGAGTGGTTKNVISTLCASEFAFEYTFTDISTSLVSTAKRTFASYNQMTFKVLDIEQEPSLDLMGKYDIVISTNCIHATKDLSATTANIRKLLKKTGILCLVELTRNLYWFDLVFGLLEGWWLFNDGRKHALASEDVWKESLTNAGYSHVDWTASDSKESEILKLIVAFNEPQPHLSTTGDGTPPTAAPNRLSTSPYPSQIRGSVVVLTGATGNLGTHILQDLLSRDEVQRVVCLNRPTSVDPVTRQLDALSRRGIHISTDCWSNKVQVVEFRGGHPGLGLAPEIYRNLCDTVTHVVHNAWPMSFRRPTNSFVPQFETLQNLLKFASDTRKHQLEQRSSCSPPRLLFISSIGVVGHHPNRESHKPVPEATVPSSGSTSLDMGYAKAKRICEEIVQKAFEDESSGAIEACFVRIGQMTGSRNYGVWNTDEHFPAMIKASQAIGSFPQLEGTASWLPVEIAAATVNELLLDPRPPQLVYHIENPARQPWSELIEQLTHLVLGKTSASGGIIPYSEWLEKIKSAPDLPTSNLIDFFEKDFTRMDCGGVVLDTTVTRRISPSLRTATPVDAATVLLYVSKWKEMGFL